MTSTRGLACVKRLIHRRFRGAGMARALACGLLAAAAPATSVAGTASPLVSVAGAISRLASVAGATSPPAGLRARALLVTNSLKTLPVPDPVDFNVYVKDRQALRTLGKALFWDQQVGSDGQACASCHYHAGADNRSKNQINPGFRNQSAAFPAGDKAFGNSPLAPQATPAFGANHQLTLEDFPLHRLADPDDARSAVLSDTNDVISSQGVFNVDFTATGIPKDVGNPRTDGVFEVGDALVRNVEPRNTPTTINAALNHRNFWDGRARNEFNGVNPIGKLDDGALIVRAGPTPQLTTVSLLDSSAASQADGPPLSELEMSYADRAFAQLGRKMLSPDLEPLAQQLVAADDSLLSAYSNQQFGSGLRGASLRYADLIRQALQPTWWDAPGWKVDVGVNPPALVQTAAEGPNLFTVMEYNFSLYFGLAVGEYEKVLISDDSPFDRWLEGDLSALGPSELAGLQVFLSEGPGPGQGRCIKCHVGPALSGAAFTNISAQRKPGNLERMVMGNFTIGVYDTAYYNIGVRPTQEDIGIGGFIGPHNRPLSTARFLQDCVKQEVTALMNEAPALALETAILRANGTCRVPPIPSRPNEAARVLLHAAELVQAIPVDVADAMALLVEANTLLAGEEPLTLNFLRGMDLTAQALGLLAAKPGLTPEVTGLVDTARRLMPDAVAPPPGGEGALPAGPGLRPDERVVADGCFKTPSLRNVELTAPYFHNGGQATLEQVVSFYDRGGDFHEENIGDLDADIGELGLTPQQKSDLVAFLKSLTDERVRYDRAPFDHPSLDIPNGGTAGDVSFVLASVGMLDDRVELPAVGSAGTAIPLGTAGTPFANFLEPLWSTMAAASGNGQSAPPGSALSSPLIVKVTDDQGHPVRGIPVTFSAPDGASVTPTSAVTSDDGTASASATLGASVGAQTFLAAAPVSGAPVAFVAQSGTDTGSGARSKAGGCGTAPGAGVPGILLALAALLIRRGRRVS